MTFDFSAYRIVNGDAIALSVKLNAVLNEIQNALNNGAQVLQTIGVLDKDLATPPVSPSNGDSYIVAATATGAWAGKEKNIAVWLDSAGAWSFIAPADGLISYVSDEGIYYAYSSSAWAASSLNTTGNGTFVNLTASGAVTLSGGTANGVPYLNGSKVLTTGSGIQFDGTRQTIESETSINIDARSNLVLSDTRAVAANNGGGILFRGVYTGTTLVDAASVQAYKLNATDGDYAYGLAFVTRANGGDLTVNMRLSPTGLAVTGTLSATGTATPLSITPTGNAVSLSVLQGIDANAVRVSAGGNTSAYLEARGYLGVKMVADSAVVGTFDADGLKFNGDTAAANAINDADKGNWSPTITALTGTFTTITVNSATYKKIDDIVAFQIKFAVISIGTGADGFQVSNMPFTAGVINAFALSGTNISNDAYFGGYVEASGTTMRFKVTMIDTHTYLVSGVYFV